MKKKFTISITIILGIVFLNPLNGFSQDMPAISFEDIAKKLNNPVASLYSLSFKENMALNSKRSFGSKNTFDILPIIPIRLSSKWNLIVQANIPVISLQLAENFVETELSNPVISLLFTTSEPKNGFVWGIGPILQLPISTSGYPFDTEKWSIGPTAVGLKQINGWTFGVVVSQMWSVAGEVNLPDLNQMSLQPFLSYIWDSGAGLGIKSDITHYWNHNYTDISINPNISGLAKLGNQIVSLMIGPQFQISSFGKYNGYYGISASAIFVFPR
jgi:hypothetical protein